MHERIERVCRVNGQEKSRFCRVAVKWFYSGRIKAVRQHELLNCTTYKGKRLQCRKWDYDIKGQKLIPILIGALIELENTKAIKPPKIDLVEGVDCNVPTSAYFMDLNRFALPEKVRKQLAVSS